MCFIVVFIHIPLLLENLSILCFLAISTPCFLNYLFMASDHSSNGGLMLRLLICRFVTNTFKFFPGLLILFIKFYKLWTPILYLNVIKSIVFLYKKIY